MAPSELRPERAEVIIPNWNRVDLLRKALISLREQEVVAPVCVVDNGSSDGSAEMVRDEFPAVRLLRLERNHGFGAALNRAVQSSPADLVIFLNNDAVADRGFVAEILNAQTESGAEMVAACLRLPDGRIDSLGIEVDAALSAYDLAHGEPYHVASSLMRPLAPTGGAGAFLRRQFEAVGGFDEAIFAYLEDVDLGMRLRIAGADCAVAYGAVAWHRHAGTLGAGSAEKNRLLAASRGYLLWKYGLNLSRVERMRGFLADAVVYGGKALLDRNLGAIRGRIDAKRRVRGIERPLPEAGFGRIPRVRLSLAAGLRRRLARRSRWT